MTKNPSKESTRPSDGSVNEDEITIAEMNVEGMPWYKTPEEVKRAEEMDKLDLTKKESRAMIKGAFQAYLPVFLITLAVFATAYGLFMLFAHFAGQ